MSDLSWTTLLPRADSVGVPHSSHGKSETGNSLFAHAECVRLISDGEWFLYIGLSPMSRTLWIGRCVWAPESVVAMRGAVGLRIAEGRPDQIGNLCGTHATATNQQAEPTRVTLCLNR